MIPRSLIALLIASAISASAQTQSRLSSDIIDTYTEMIAARPSEAGLYLSRATEYFSQGLLSPALTDLNDALRLAGKGDKELKFEILMQRAAVLERQRDYEGALSDIEAASEIFPDYSSLLLTRARILTSLSRYPEAREYYNRYKRLNPRSAEAIFGLAKVSGLEGDSDKALAYMNEGIDAAPRSGLSYLSASEIHTLLGRDDEAVADCIKAIACGDESSGIALQKLVDLSNENYSLVMTGLDRAITKSPTSGELYYLRATIAQDHDHHRNALTDFNRIDGVGPFAGGALGESMAESMLALAMPEDALSQLERVPAHLHGTSWHTLRAKILLSLGRREESLSESSAVLNSDPENIDAAETKVRALIALDRKEEALAEASAAILTDPVSRPVLYFLGASLANGARRERMIEEASELPFDPADPASLKGFAMLAAGQTDPALVWASSVGRFDTVGDGTAHFTAACLYAQADKPDEALAALEKALGAGFDNLYLIRSDNTHLISIAPLRSDLRFQTLLSKFKLEAQ